MAQLSRSVVALALPGVTEPSHSSRDDDVVTESAEEWRQRNASWVRENEPLIRAAFALFLDSGDWPTVRFLRRKFAPQGGPKIDVEEAVRTQPTGYELAQRVTFEYLFLGVRHLIGIPEAQPLLNLLTVVASRAAEVYTESVTEEYVSSDDPSIIAFFDRAAIGEEERARLLMRLPKLLASDYPAPIHGQSESSGSWRLQFDEQVVEHFHDVGSPADYVNRQLEILVGRAEEAARHRPALEAALLEMGPAALPGYPPTPFSRLTVVSVPAAPLAPDLDRSDEPPQRTKLEAQLITSLEATVPLAAPCYIQALNDLDDSSRVSFRGTANELRAAVWEVLEAFAPDELVMAEEGFQLEKDRDAPTHAQRARFIVRGRLSSTAQVAPEESLAIVELHVGRITRGLYGRSSASAHVESERSEVGKIKAYVDALLLELLDLQAPATKRTEPLDLP